MRCCLPAVLSFLALSASAYADPDASPFAGPYLGGQAGILSGERSAGASGVHLGYGATLGAPLVLGVEVEFDRSSRPFTDPGQRVEGLTRFKVRAGGRNGDMLLYGLGGLSILESNRGQAQGGLIGAGGQISLGNGRSLGLELTHEDFDEIGATGRGISLTGLSFRAGLSF